MTYFLEKLKIFEGISSSQGNIIEKHCEFKIFQKGSVIIKEGDRPNLFYILLKGIVSVYKNEDLINTIFEGDIFGEIALVTQEPRIATIIAETDIEVLAFEKDVFLNILKKFDPTSQIQTTILNRIIMNHKK